MLESLRVFPGLFTLNATFNLALKGPNTHLQVGDGVLCEEEIYTGICPTILSTRF